MADASSNAQDTDPNRAGQCAVEMRGITKRFGEVLANDHLDIAVPNRSIHAIIGENGAGKSTAMRILYGFYQADSGEIQIDGKPAEIKTPADAIRLGLGMVHQHFMLVDRLTVTDNIILGEEPLSGLTIDYRRARATVADISERYGLKINPDAKVANLSVGQQQRIEILKVLYRGARILILDEPTAVLTPQEVDDLFATLVSLRDQGKTVIIITHKLSEVLALSENITVMRDGRVVGNLETRDATAADLARMMVGRDVLLRVRKPPAKPGPPVLSVQGINLKRHEGHHVLKDVSFEVHSGEILSIAGVEGNGQTELIEVLAGLEKPDSGQVLLDGKPITDRSARERKRLGIAHIPEDRLKRGLLADFDLAENSILGVQDSPSLSRFFVLNHKHIEDRARRLVKEYDVRPPNIALPARSLSGGNQQKLIIAREFDIHPKLLLVAQPTRGVDIGATEFIHRKLVELRDSGAAVLLVSAELDEVLSLGDRLLVMYEGRIVGEADPLKAKIEEIGMLMTGGKGMRHRKGVPLPDESNSGPGS